MNNLFLSYYGDDFTGSTDVMEALTLGGVRAALFLKPPSPDRLQGRFADLQALGVAGISRSMTPAQMEEELRPKFGRLKELGAPLFHYKICSTFDSSPEIGSIGQAVDIGVDTFRSTFVPMMVGAPVLKRYVVFGNLFATATGVTYRIDRHPTMSRHPITPMDEGDLRHHLAKQTKKSISLIDVLHLAGQGEELDATFSALLEEEKPEVVLFDTLDNSHLSKIGRLIWEQRGDQPLFLVGSSGIEYALTAYWQEIGLVPKPELANPPGTVDQLIVMSGSAAPGTADQISWALDNGFADIRIDTVSLVDPDKTDAERLRVTKQALEALATGHSLVIYTAHGPDDPAIPATRRHLETIGLDTTTLGRRIGEPQGWILRELLQKTGLRRACVAGGDTSGYVALQLGIYALEMIVPIAPGSPLCRASADDPAFDDLEISLKGGQVGQPRYFGQIQQGHM
jgi:uncharacterized protein YgbK (DUF1537 family)